MISLFSREVAFWNPNASGMIERSGRAPDVQAQTARYPFEITLHQGAIEKIFLDTMSARGLIVDRPTTVHDWQVLSIAEAKNGYRIKVTLQHLTDENNTVKAESKTNDGKEDSNKEIIYAKYVIGCDGAHSWVRKKLGFTMDGQQTGKRVYITFVD